MKLLLSVIVLLSCSIALSQEYVEGYTRRDGTYVAPHYRSTPDSSLSNNWSQPGNVNPYTGAEKGYNPYSNQMGHTFTGQGTNFGQ
jgi:hypothetical protein